MHAVVNVLDPTSLLQTFGVIGVFLVLFAETGLLVGFFLPGDSLLFTAGLLTTTSTASSVHLSLPAVGGRGHPGRAPAGLADPRHRPLPAAHHRRGRGGLTDPRPDRGAAQPPSGHVQGMTATVDTMTTTSALRGGFSNRTLLNKVPEVTAFFWIIKILCTTVGESAADDINETLGVGLTGTSLIMTVLLVVVLVVQFRTQRYVAGVYWLAVVLISVVGTLVTDNLSDGLGVSLLVTTPVFAVLLAVTFAAWYRREGTLSIHAVDTTSREAWYWLTVLLTFALGTAAGDLIAERLSLGFGPTVILFAALIALVAAARYAVALNAVLAFWVAYILTRPLGASIGDFLSADKVDGGQGLGTLVTSLIFLAVILALVVYLSVRKVDVIEAQPQWTGHTQMM